MKREQPGSSRVHGGDTSYRRTLRLFSCLEPFYALKKRHDASVVIQSAFRAYLVRSHISKMKQNAVLIQRWFRLRQEYMALKLASVTIQ
uniref:Abnormal spindle microtubule assembly n=1 Tax=Sinocyclocheilus rhinocerous TaxID=307959 RepID=A0A673NE79_9TELE